MESPLSAGDIAAVHEARAIGLSIRLALNGRAIVLDRGGADLPPQTVVIVWANREPQRDGSPAIETLGQDGELQGWPELDVRIGDLFALDGGTCEVDGPVVTDAGIRRAGFRRIVGGA